MKAQKTYKEYVQSYVYMKNVTNEIFNLVTSVFFVDDMLILMKINTNSTDFKTSSKHMKNLNMLK